MAKIKLLDLYHSELISGILLMLSFMAALFVANVPGLDDFYRALVFFQFN